MYCISVLTDKDQDGKSYAESIIDCCADRNLSPLVEIFCDQEKFFRQIQKRIPDAVLFVLPGVSGLNAVEHLRSLHPECGIIWCSDLDFSLHAYKLRIEYFFMEPVEKEKIREGLRVWMTCKKHSDQ